MLRLLVFFLFSANVFAASAKLPPLLKEVEAKYAKAGTLSANFTETDEIASLHQKKISSGTILFRRPKQIRWETTKPEQGRSLLVSDGKKVWYYTPPFDADDSGQYWEKPASAVQSKFAQSLLAGSFAESVSKRDMKVTEVSTTDFLMTPRKNSAGDTKEATLHVDPEHHVITGVDVVHANGNKTEIRLSEVQVGAKLADSLFKFVPPTKTEKIDLN